MNQLKQPTRCNHVIEFINPKFTESPTCFERHTAQHQELQTVLAVSGLYTHVVPGRCPGWVDPASMWPHVYVICACLVFLSVGDLLVHKQITNKQEHQTRTPEDGREERPKHVGVL